MTAGIEARRTACRPQELTVVVPLFHEPTQPLTDPFFAGLLSHLTDEITLRGYDMRVRKVLPPAPDWLARLIEDERPAGIIVIGQSGAHAALNAAAASYRPLVVWGGVEEDATYCTVTSDNVYGGMLATEHLISLGRKRIVFFGNPQAPEIAKRHKGYRIALERAGLPMNLVVPARLTAEDAGRNAESIVAARGQFDAIFAASDLIATTVIQALTAAGIRVPDDVAVAGFDDLPIASTLVPPLTSVRQDLRTVARLLVEHVVRRMAGEDTPSVVLEPELIRRASTARAA